MRYADHAASGFLRNVKRRFEKSRKIAFFLLSGLFFSAAQPIAESCQTNPTPEFCLPVPTTHRPDYARTFHNMLKNNNLNINIFLKT